MALEFTVYAEFIDFRFFLGSVDQPVSSSVVESLVKHVADPLWQPGLKTIPAWMIVSDLRRHPAVVEFISSSQPWVASIRRGFLTCRPLICLSSRRSSCSQGSGQQKELPLIYVDFLTCSVIFPCHKVFRCPKLAPDSRRYKVNPKQWSEPS